MTGLHPSVRIIALLVLAGVVQLMHWRALGILALALGVMLLYFRATMFGNVVRRARWLLLTLVLIYAFTTPGEYLRDVPFDILPTYEGIDFGLQQAVRLILMLAGLTLLLTTTAREQLMAGAYQLLRPLRWLGLAPERFAARLWLTMHYVEQTPLPRRQALQQLLGSFHTHAEPVSDMERITISLPRPGRVDVLALLLFVVLGWGFLHL